MYSSSQNNSIIFQSVLVCSLITEPLTSVALFVKILVCLAVSRTVHLRQDAADVTLATS